MNSDKNLLLYMDKKYAELGIEEIDGKKVFVASDETVDREGEILGIDGWQLENFKRNPVILWSHNPFEPMIGRADNIRYRTVAGKKKLTFEPVFHKMNELSNLVSELVDKMWMKTVSVGFRPFEKEGNKFTKQELLEISFVNIPANPEATQLGLSKSYGKETIDKLFGKADPATGLDKDESTEEDKRVIAFKETAVAPRINDWDGAKEVSKATDTTELKRMSAWYDESDADSKSAYKLAHHSAGNENPVVFRGVVAAMATLLGSDEIPAEDRKGVYNHLAKHYAQFNEDPPEFRDYSAEELKQLFPQLYFATIHDLKQLTEEIKGLGKAIEFIARPTSEPGSRPDDGRRNNRNDRKRLIQIANKALSKALEMEKNG